MDASKNFVVAICNTKKHKLHKLVFSSETGKEVDNILKDLNLKKYNLGDGIYLHAVDNILDVGMLRKYQHGWVFSGEWRSSLKIPGIEIPRTELPFHLAEYAISLMASDNGAGRNERPVEISISVAKQLVLIVESSIRGIKLLDDFILEDVDTVNGICESLKLHELHAWLTECFNSDKYFTV